MSLRVDRGQVATEFALLCALLAVALCVPWGGEAPVVARWFRAWLAWRAAGLHWLADG
jgi:hypothetical protein